MSPPLTHTRYSLLPHPVHVCQWDSHEIILFMNLLTICLFLLESKYDNSRNLFWLAHNYILVWGTVFSLQEIVSASWITEPWSKTATRQNGLQHGFSELRGTFTNLSIRKNLNPLGFIQSCGHGTVYIVWNTGLLTGWESQVPAYGVCILYVC